MWNLTHGMCTFVGSKMALFTTFAGKPMYEVTLIPGDGIGPSIAESAVRIIEATGVKIAWEKVEAGMAAIEKYKDPLPKHVIESITRTRMALKGPLTTPVGSGFRSVNVALRKEFDLYSNVRPAHTFEGVSSQHEDLDIVIVRKNSMQGSSTTSTRSGVLRRPSGSSHAPGQPASCAMPTSTPGSTTGKKSRRSIRPISSSTPADSSLTCRARSLRSIPRSNRTTASLTTWRCRW